MAEAKVASYYGKGDGFAGKLTASGKPFDPHKLTAAHKTLPFGTKVQVRNLKNDKIVIVEINDRGPYTHGREIDLSYAAAKQIAMVDEGIAKVELTILT
jgi:rare lipoprotein A